MRRRIAIYGLTEETLELLPQLEANPDVEVAAVYHPDRSAAARLARPEDLSGETLERLLTDQLSVLEAPPGLHALVDSGIQPALAEALPGAATHDVQRVSPLQAGLLWGYRVSPNDRKSELLKALHEIVDSVNLTVDPDELFARMLEIAMGVTGADGGSLMLLDDAQMLRVRVAIGVERELWPKIQVPLGEGIAGRVASDARPIRLRGKADRQAFRIVRERFDVESALCVPLVHQGRVLGVLNLHHASRPEAFSDEDLDFAEQLGHLDAEIVARAQDHERLRSQAGRYGAVQEVRKTLSGGAPLLDRLGALCRMVAERLGKGIVTVYLHDADSGELHLAATSLQGGGFGGDYRVVVGQGVDGRAAATRAPAFLRGAEGELAYAAVPLLSDGELLGVLSVQAGNDPAGQTPLARDRAFEESLLEIASAAADEIGHASREARMSARATKVSAINEAGIRLISAREISEVVGLATSSGALILEADQAVLRLQDADTQRFVIRSYYGGADGRGQEKLFRLDKRVTVNAIKRRDALIVKQTAREADYADIAGSVQSLVAAPLLRDGRVIGTLALYDKIAPDQFYAGCFSEDDLQIFRKYVSYVEKAVSNALYYAHDREHRSVDEETGLPNADSLARRIDQEIARAAGREEALALVTCRIENLAAIRRETNPIHADRVLRALAGALAGQLREFDLLARNAEAEFAVLLPEPGHEPEARVVELARSVADEIAKDEALNAKIRIALVFGYVVGPGPAGDREGLLGRARVGRIHML